MTVIITSWVPAYAGGESVTLIAPNHPGSEIGKNFTDVNDILIGTGPGTFTSATMSDILDGTYVPPTGPAGYSYFDLVLSADGSTAPVGTLVEPLNVNGNYIVNVRDPFNPQDAATKNYVDTEVGLIGGGFLQLAGGTMTGALLTDTGVQILSDAGTAPLPAIAFSASPTTGVYLSAADEISLSTAATVALTIRASGALVVPIGYETLVTTDDVIPNKKYVDTTIDSVVVGNYLELIGGTMTGVITFVGDKTSGQLFPYDNTSSSLIANDMQDAIDELNTSIGVIIGSYVTSFNTRTGDVLPAASDYTAAQVDYDDTSTGLGATNVQDAIVAIDTVLDTINGDTYVNSFNTRTGDVLPATSDYTAAQVDYDNSGTTLVANKVQAAITELDGTVDGIVTGGPYLPLAGDTMTGVITFAGGITAGQLFPYDPTYSAGNDLSATNVQSAIDELEIRVANNETDLLDGPFLPLTGGNMTGAIDAGGFVISDVGAPISPDDAATMGYVDGAIIALGDFLPLTGGNMTGAITGLSTLTVGAHVLGTSTYESINGGNSFRITTDAAVTAAAPTYSFIGADDMGMYSSGTELRFAVGGEDLLTLARNVTAPHVVSVNNNKIENVADPVNDQDAVTKKWITDMTAIRVLNDNTIAVNVDLMVEDTPPISPTSGTVIVTVPVGRKQIYTQLIVRASAYNPVGGSGGPTIINPSITVGRNGPAGDGDNILDTIELNWGAGGAADQTIIIPLGDNGAPSATPNPNDTISIIVQVPAGGSFTELKADFYLVGMEITS